MMVDKSLLVLELWKDIDQFKYSVVKLKENRFTQIFDAAVHPDISVRTTSKTCRDKNVLIHPIEALNRSTSKSMTMVQIMTKPLLRLGSHPQSNHFHYGLGERSLVQL